MGWIAALLYFFIALFPALCASMLEMSQQVKSVAEIDEKLAAAADETCTYLNNALSLNVALLGLYAACPSATVTGQLGTIKANAATIEEQQDALLAQAQEKASWLRIKFRTESHFPKRFAMGPCELPDLLRCTNSKIFSYQNAAPAQAAGVEGNVAGPSVAQESFLCNEVRWSFRDSRVNTL